MKSKIICLFAVFLLKSCVPEGLMRTWSTTEEYDRKLNNLLVMGLVNNVNLRNEVENEVVYAGKKEDLRCVNGMSMFPPELGKPFEDVERAKERLRQNGFDGVITVALVDINEERYISPSVEYEPLLYYNRFGNYFFRTYDLVYRPGYFTQNTKYFIETNVYELKGGKLIWSGRSTVFGPNELNQYLPVYARGLFKELKIEGMIQK
ncbi:hypothetical protein [Ekhidna sp. To15]|uniref:hypothetical protein n=1 Tax=Ekhidna sp. To15 TaxID=3395267 RepID=UPI003F525EF2